MYVGVKYIVLRAIRDAISDGCTRIYLGNIRQLILHDLPIYSNIILVQTPDEADRYIWMAIGELDSILVGSAPEDIGVSECLSFESEDVLVVNRICLPVLAGILEILFRGFKHLVKKKDVSLTGQLVEKISRSLDAIGFEYMCVEH